MIQDGADINESMPDVGSHSAESEHWPMHGQLEQAQSSVGWR